MLHSALGVITCALYPLGRRVPVVALIIFKQSLRATDDHHCRRDNTPINCLRRGQVRYRRGRYSVARGSVPIPVLLPGPRYISPTVVWCGDTRRFVSWAQVSSHRFYDPVASECLSGAQIRGGSRLFPTLTIASPPTKRSSVDVWTWNSVHALSGRLLTPPC